MRKKQRGRTAARVDHVSWSSPQGWLALLTAFVPMLRAAGLTDADVARLVDNRRRALTPASTVLAGRAQG